MRRNQFTVNAESVQGNPEATVTFRKLTIGTRDRYLNVPDFGDLDLLNAQIADWSGIIDDDGHEIPSPKDEPSVTAALYLDEARELIRLLFQGPDGENAKN